MMSRCKKIEPMCWFYRYPNLPILALTATATPRVEHDVIQQLCLRECVTFRSSFNRPNLRHALQLY